MGVFCDSCSDRITNPQAQYSRGSLTVDRDAQLVLWKGNEIRLPKSQFNIVDILASAPKKIKSTTALLILLDSEALHNTLSVHVCRLRKAFCAVDPKFDALKNRPREGWYWEETPE